mgnify:CR=1 FL=1
MSLLNGMLAFLLVALAVRTVFVRDAFPAVLAFIIYGLLLTLVWMLLRGVDVALTEAAIGGGLTVDCGCVAAARHRKRSTCRTAGTCLEMVCSRRVRNGDSRTRILRYAFAGYRTESRRCSGQ